MNIKPQILGHVEGIVAQELLGTVNLSPGAIEMLRLSERNGDEHATELKAVVYELEDTTSPATGSYPRFQSSRPSPTQGSGRAGRNSSIPGETFCSAI